MKNPFFQYNFFGHNLPQTNLDALSTILKFRRIYLTMEIFKDVDTDKYRLHLSSAPFPVLAEFSTILAEYDNVDAAQTETSRLALCLNAGSFLVFVAEYNRTLSPEQSHPTYHLMRDYLADLT